MYYSVIKADYSNGDTVFVTIIRTVILYILIVFAVRVMGKRQISEMQPSELVITLIIADIASIPMEDNSRPMLSGIVPMLILVALEIIVSVLMMKSALLRKAVCGSPVMIIKDGILMQDEMKRLRITTEDLCVQLRESGVFSLSDVQYCIAETNGKLSVLQKPQKRNPSCEDMKLKPKDAGLDVVVINDGKYLDNSIKLVNADKQLINKILNKECCKLSEVFIMTLNQIGDYSIIRKQ